MQENDEKVTQSLRKCAAGRKDRASALEPAAHLKRVAAATLQDNHVIPMFN